MLRFTRIRFCEPEPDIFVAEMSGCLFVLFPSFHKGPRAIASKSASAVIPDQTICYGLFRWSKHTSVRLVFAESEPNRIELQYLEGRRQQIVSTYRMFECVGYNDYRKTRLP